MFLPKSIKLPALAVPGHHPILGQSRRQAFQVHQGQGQVFFQKSLVFTASDQLLERRDSLLLEDYIRLMPTPERPGNLSVLRGPGNQLIDFSRMVRLIPLSLQGPKLNLRA